MSALERLKRRIRVVVDCDTTDQFLDVLAYAKMHGLTPQIGEAEALPQIKIKRRKKAAPTNAKPKPKRVNPKRYPRNMLVRVSNAKVTLNPIENELLEVIEEKYGNKPFVKGEVKKLAVAKLGSRYSSSRLTSLLDKGAVAVA